MTLVYMLDSDICIDLVRSRNAGLADRVRRAGPVLAVSTIVQTELLVGVAKAPDSQKASQRVEGLLARLSILSFDETAAGHAADIRANLERSGTKIGAYDGLIAGHARSLGLVLITGNGREFSRVPGLRVEDWRTAAGDMNK